MAGQESVRLFYLGEMLRDKLANWTIRQSVQQSATTLVRGRDIMPLVGVESAGSVPRLECRLGPTAPNKVRLGHASGCAIHTPELKRKRNKKRDENRWMAWIGRLIRQRARADRDVGRRTPRPMMALYPGPSGVIVLC